MAIGTGLLFRAVTRGWNRIIAGAINDFPGMSASMAKRFLIRQVSPSIVRSGIAWSRALSQMRNVGLGIRTQDFWNVMRTGRELVETQDYLRGLGGDERIDVTHARLAEYSHLDRYTAKIRVHGTDPWSGEPRQRWVTAGVGEGETPNEILGRMQDEFDMRVQEGRGGYSMNIDSIDMEDLEVTPEVALPWGGAFDDLGL